MKSEVLILAFETSCDETAVAVARDGNEILSDIIYSQIKFHNEYGGVVPEIASRKHIEKINLVTEKALAEAGAELKDINAIAVTYGPGLVGPLLIGVSFAKALAFATDIPLIGVHHIEGHICANFIEHKNLRPPFISLVVSGGHSHLVIVKDYGEYEVIGRTRDDAAGEAFDKAARAMGLPYPGGPHIDRLAAAGDPRAIRFPRPRLQDGNKLDFSFSGLKTALRQYVEGHGDGAFSSVEGHGGSAFSIEDIAASFQQAVVDVLVAHTMLAAKQTGYKRLALAGGVACNQ
ncbi:MAG: tRNA (adenosine(37)-N6)-threonylcarbamoyltransferase complex transferase subunit TsaD, partial [Lachnospiraceae bacterium]|nr:tRNA (adenosine(37)-N6)-threonylcarbamoyltransferase complex transferase subunit TsaD [Lachnospiraceae bacterium]